MTDLPNLMDAPILDISIGEGDKFLLRNATYLHTDRIRSIPGSWQVGGGKDYWRVPRTWVSLKILIRLFPDGLNFQPEVVEWANEMWTNTIEPALTLRNEGAKQEWIDAVAQTLPVGIEAKDYQVAGAFFLPTAKRAMLFDEQGTGKMTQTALTFSLYPDTFPALVIAPKGVVWTWKRELAKFGIEAVVVDGGAADRRKQFAEFQDGSAQVLVISYGLMSKHSRVSGYGTITLSDEHKQPKEIQQTKWSTVIADEAHRIKDPHSVQTRACWAASEKATYRWATTGTPMESNMLDMWALLHFIDPDEWPSKTKYQDLWVHAIPKFFGGFDILGVNPLTADEFRSLTEWHWRRVLKSEDLPPVTYDLRLCVIDGKPATAYKNMKKQLMAELDSDGSFETLFAANNMVKAGRLKQFASATCMIDAEDNVRMVEPSWKLDALEEAMEDYEDQPAIYWFDNRDLLHMFEERLTKAGKEFVSIHGDVTGKDRDDAMQRFQAGLVDHILVTYGAGSEGTTLTRAPVAFRVQRPWSFIQDSQAPFRNLRIGSEIHDKITYVDIVTKGTVEEEWLDVLEKKGESSQEILRDVR